jgi:hypothetical protein
VPPFLSLLCRHEVERVAPIVELNFVGSADLKNVGGSGSEILNENRKAGDGRGDYGTLADCYAAS